jgi:hypothetical protein
MRNSVLSFAKFSVQRWGLQRSPTVCTIRSPSTEVTMYCDPDLAVISARFSRMANELWIAAREALADRKHTFFPDIPVKDNGKDCLVIWVFGSTRGA